MPVLPSALTYRPSAQSSRIRHSAEAYTGQPVMPKWIARKFASCSTAIGAASTRPQIPRVA